LKGYENNPEKAKELLKEAGFPKGFKTQLVTRNDAIWVKISQAVQQDLAAVGIRAEIREVSRATWLDAIGRPAGAPLQWGDWIQDFPDPDDFLNVLYNSDQIAEVNSNNNNFYSNPRVDSLLARAQRLTEIEKRVPLYQEAERIIVEDAPSAYCYHSMRHNLGAPGLHGYRSHPVYGIYFNKMYYE
jgi:ABC-type transport system substrate-binding protein